MPREYDRPDEKKGWEGKDKGRESRRHSNESHEWKVKGIHRDSRSRSPVFRKDQYYEARYRDGIRNGGYHNGRYQDRYDRRRSGAGYQKSWEKSTQFGYSSSGSCSTSSFSDNYSQEQILLPRPDSYQHPGRTFPKQRHAPRPTVYNHHDEDEEVDAKPFPPPTNWLRRTPVREIRTEPMRQVSFETTPRPLFGRHPPTLADGSPLPKNGGASGHLLAVNERREMENQRSPTNYKNFKKDDETRYKYSRTPEPGWMRPISPISIPRPLFSEKGQTFEDGTPLPKTGGTPGHTLNAMEKKGMEKYRTNYKVFKADEDNHIKNKFYDTYLRTAQLIVTLFAPAVLHRSFHDILSMTQLKPFKISPFQLSQLL